MIAIVALIVLSEAAGLSQGVTGIVLTVLIVGGVIGYGCWSEARILATCRALRAQLLASHPVAYACALELASSKSMFSADAGHLSVWEIEGGELVEIVRVPRASVQVTRGRVRAAAAKQYDGLHLDWSEDSQAHRLRLSLYAVSFWGLLIPMRGAKLDAAVDALRHSAGGM